MARACLEDRLSEAGDLVESIWSDGEVVLAKLGTAGLTSSPLEVVEGTGPVVTMNHESFANFASDNCLDLANHPRVKDALKTFTARHGVGCQTERGNGSSKAHQQLESDLCEIYGAQAAVTFSSDYLALNAATQASSVRSDGSHVPILFDRAGRPALLDAALTSGGPWRTFAHNNMEDLENKLKAARSQCKKPPTALVATEGVFSALGDLSPLRDMLRLCMKHEAVLLIDDSYSLGTVGPGGRGAASCHALPASRNVVHIGSLAKSLGAAGGFAAGTSTFCNLIRTRARAFLDDPGLSIGGAAAGREALCILREEPQKTGLLIERSVYLRNELRARKLDVTVDYTPIIPIPVNDAAECNRMQSALRKAGFLTRVSHPPFVLRNQSSIRISVMITHGREQLRGLADAVERASAHAQTLSFVS